MPATDIGKFLSLVRYPPETIPIMTRINIPANTTVTVNEALQIPRNLLLAVESVATQPNNNLLLTFVVDGAVLRSMRASSLLLTENFPVDMKAISRLLLRLTNTGGVAINDHPVRVTYTAYHMQTTYKLFIPELFRVAGRSPKLTPEEEQLVNEFQLLKFINLGRFPADRTRFQSQTPVKYEEAVFWQENVTSSDIVLASFTPKSEDEVLILRELTSEQPTTPGDNMEFTVKRDGDEFVFDASAMPGLGTTLNFWIPAIRELEITVKADVAQVRSGRIRVARARLTPLAKLRWGLPLTPEEEQLVNEERLREKILLGMA